MSIKKMINYGNYFFSNVKLIKIAPYGDEKQKLAKK
jgi:hypothetical protein